MISIPCNIAILPSEDLARKLVTASRQVSDQPTLFTLDQASCVPHASLYMTQLNLDGIDAVKAALETIAQSTAVIDLHAARYGQKMGYLDAEYHRTEPLDLLQMRVVAAVNPLRDGMRQKDRLRMAQATGLAKENFEQYGYPAIGELFRPHATITRFVDDASTGIVILPEHAHFSGQFTRLGLFEMGDNGTCVRELASYTLQ